MHTVKPRGTIETIVPLPSSVWNRGRKKGYGKPFLLNMEGKLCCLGLLGRSRGVLDSDLYGVGTPTGACQKRPANLTAFEGLVYKERAFFIATTLTAEIIGINDGLGGSDEERVRLLNEKVADLGIHFEFMGDE